MPIETKRTCKVCKKVWCSPVLKEKELKDKIGVEDVRQTLSVVQGNYGTAAQERKNSDSLRDNLDRSKTCPECGSSNFIEEIIDETSFSTGKLPGFYCNINGFSVNQNVNNTGDLPSSALINTTCQIDKKIYHLSVDRVKSLLLESFKLIYDFRFMIGICKQTLFDDGFKIVGGLINFGNYEVETTVKIVETSNYIKVSSQCVMIKRKFCLMPSHGKVKEYESEHLYIMEQFALKIGVKFN